jgi:hypothetical protein
LGGERHALSLSIPLVEPVTTAVLPLNPSWGGLILCYIFEIPF